TMGCGARSGLSLGDGAAGAGSGEPVCSPGDPPVALVTGLTGPYSVGVDETYAYFITRDGALMKVPKSGGQVTGVPEGLDLSGNLAIDATHLYVADSSGILRMAKDGTDLTTIVSDPTVDILAIDDTSLYWARAGSTIASVPKAGGSSVT